MFDYLAKGAKQREQAVAEEQVCAVVRSLRRRRGGGDQLLAYRSGPRWHDVTAADINDYLREVSGGDYTAMDFRTWHATLLAAVGLAVSEGASGSDAARNRAIARVVREVAGYLGNTPAVARASYIDPRIIELYEDGSTIASVLGDLGKNRDFGDLATRGRAETAVVKLLHVTPGNSARRTQQLLDSAAGNSTISVTRVPRGPESASIGSRTAALPTGRDRGAQETDPARPSDLAEAIRSPSRPGSGVPSQMPPPPPLPAAVAESHWPPAHERPGPHRQPGHQTALPDRQEPAPQLAGRVVRPSRTPGQGTAGRLLRPSPLPDRHRPFAPGISEYPKRMITDDRPSA